MPSSRGFDAGKKINGRKWHILVDTLGLMLTVGVTTAYVQDRDSLKKLLRTFGLHRKKSRKIWDDGSYHGQILEWLKARFLLGLENHQLTPSIEAINNFLRLKSNYCTELSLVKIFLRRHSS